MSGYKRATVTISEEEYRRLHEADMKKRFRAPSRAANPETRHSPELVNTLEQMERRQRHLEQALNDLNQSHSRSGYDAIAMQEVIRQHALSYERLESMLEQTRSAANDSLVELAQAFAGRMNQDREEYRYHLQTLIQRLDSYEQEDNARESLARHWLNQSMMLAEFIRNELEHERFAPGRYSRILPNLTFAQDNLAQGLFEASLQTSQQTFLQLSELQYDVETRLVEWQTEYERAYRAIRETIAQMELNASVNAFGLDGEELPDLVDLAYWTHGRYDQLLENCRQVLQALEQEQCHIPVEDLRRTPTQWLPAIMDRFESMIYEARLNALNSQLRMNIAERALQALENQGFHLGEAGYASDDMRGAFLAYLDNPDGSRVSIQVLPPQEPSQDLINELIVITEQSEIKSEQEVRLQWQELRRSLDQDDLRVSQPDLRAEPPIHGSEVVEGAPLLNRSTVRSGK
jgi:hypothetical protein